MQCIRSNIFKTLFTVALFSANFAVHAEGMVPETSLLIIDEATHSGTINVKNTDSRKPEKVHNSQRDNMFIQNSATGVLHCFFISLFVYTCKPLSTHVN